MKITRDVITDLLPVYLAGEASPDTRSLVEDYLKEDPEFAKLIAGQNTPLAQTTINIPKETEMQTLEKTRSLLRKRSFYLGFAIFFTLFTISFKFDANGIYWMWTDTPIVAITCLIVGTIMWMMYARTNQRLGGSDL